MHNIRLSIHLHSVYSTNGCGEPLGVCPRGWGAKQSHGTISLTRLLAHTDSRQLRDARQPTMHISGLTEEIGES